MQLRIDNIGPISSAHIDLMGLTVIGGLNDTGKSTIGKALFAIVQAIRNRQSEYISYQRARINSLISELVTDLRASNGSNISPIALRQAAIGIRNVGLFIGADKEEKLTIAITATKERILVELARRANTTPRGEQGSIFPTSDEILSQESIVDDYLSRMREVLLESIDSKALYFASLSQMFNSVMHGEINSLRNLSSGTVSLTENDNDILNATFSENALRKLSIKEDVIFSLFEEATLIESPFILNFAKSEDIYPPNPSNRQNYSYSDLISKLNFAVREATPNNPLEQSIADLIGSKIEGKIYYDSDDEEFIFSTLDGVKVNIANAASGVKTLGMIQMLASAGFLNNTNLLIIDEPEVHLHPAWQIVFAEIIAKLVSNNVYCLVSSHSPYFIQAIEAYAAMYNLQNSTKFYVSRKQEGLCSFDDITDNVEPLYKLLADPMKEIAFLKNQVNARKK